MAKINDGGPAFPLHPGINPDWALSAGMSLRDWFAGQALMGKISSMGDGPLDLGWGEHPDEALARDAKRRAKWCYQQADAMLAARAEGGAG